MTEKSKDQLRYHVERQLADKGSLLTFSPMVKARYEEETGTARCRHLVICGLVALALYNVFLISDWRLIRDISDQALIVRLAVVTPLALLIVAILLRFGFVDEWIGADKESLKLGDAVHRSQPQPVRTQRTILRDLESHP